MGNDSHCKILLNGSISEAVVGKPGYYYEASRGGEHEFTFTTAGHSYPTLDSSIKKFGDSSWHFPSSGGDIGILVSGPDTSDWNVTSDDFTIDLWQYGSNGTVTPNIFIAGVYLDASNYWGIKYTVAGTPNVLSLNFTVKVAGTTLLDINYPYTIDANVFAHTAIVKQGSTITMYLDGTAMTSGTLATIPTINSDFRIGTFCGGSCSDSIFHIDEFRYSKGIARWITDFEPPNRAN